MSARRAARSTSTAASKFAATSLREHSGPRRRTWPSHALGARRLGEATPLRRECTPGDVVPPAVAGGIGQRRQLVARSLDEDLVEPSLLGLLQDGAGTVTPENLAFGNFAVNVITDSGFVVDRLASGSSTGPGLFQQPANKKIQFGGTLAGLLISESRPLFGFREFGYRSEIVISIGLDVATVVLLATFLALRTRSDSRHIGSAATT